MPIYEYLCPDCNRIYSFFSHKLNPAKPPACPKCGSRKLRKRLSGFAVTGAAKKSAGAANGDAGAADPRVEQEMMRLMQQAEGMDENDPRQMGRLMRKMAELTGEKDRNLEEAIRRLEAGEDPEAVEADMGDLLGGNADSAAGGVPTRDGGLYDM
jgi:putative FmdB family regulatory protein